MQLGSHCVSTDFRDGHAQRHKLSVVPATVLVGTRTVISDDQGWVSAFNGQRLTRQRATGFGNPNNTQTLTQTELPEWSPSRSRVNSFCGRFKWQTWTSHFFVDLPGATLELQHLECFTSDRSHLVSRATNVMSASYWLLLHSSRKRFGQIGPEAAGKNAL